MALLSHPMRMTFSKNTIQKGLLVLGYVEVRDLPPAGRYHSFSLRAILNGTLMTQKDNFLKEKDSERSYRAWGLRH